MRAVTWLVVALLLTCTFAEEPETGEVEPEGPVKVLTVDNFDDWIAQHPLTLVKFFAPWCGHCKQLAPIYVDAAIKLAGKASLAEVDCTENRDLCSKFNVQGFPTVKLFGEGEAEPVDYEGARDIEAISRFVLKQLEPAYVVLQTEKEVRDFLAGKRFAVVGFMGADAEPAIAEFVSLAKALRNDYDFAYSTSSDVAEAFSVKEKPEALIFKEFDEPRIEFEGEWSETELGSWIVENSFPVFGEIGPENYKSYIDRGYPFVWVFLNYDDESDKALMEQVRGLAGEFRNALSFVHLDGIKWEEYAKNFGLNGKTPGFVIEHRQQRKHFILPQDKPVTPEAIKSWVQGFIDKTLEPTLKSEPIPESNDGPVIVVVGKTFDQIVMDPTKDVMVEFYAPWCGHCKALAPKYEILAQKFENDKTIVVAKIDATANDTPVTIRGYPSIMFYPADNKDAPITYDGARTENALAKFIKENASTLKKAEAPKDAEKEDL